MRMKAKTILLVDDEKELLGIFTRIFGNDGYRVLTATSGEEAIEISKKCFPELIIMDYHLPGINGLKTVAKIKAINDNCIFVMVSGVMDADLAKKAKRLGVQYCFSKPLKVETVNELLEEV